MLRVYFPAGDLINEASSHSDFKSDFSKGANPQDYSDKDKASVNLLSRVFSLLNFDTGANTPPLILKKEHLDFDLALFNTYATTFK